MNRCTQCVLPETYPGILFDEKGVCNSCSGFRAFEIEGEDRLTEIVERYKGRRGKYDCIVALSGGRDSTYALHYAVKKLGLRVLAISVDNGCLPRETQENIENAVRILGVDLVIEKHSQLQRSLKPLLSAWLHRPSPAMIASICLGCRYGMQRSFYRMAAKYKIPLLMSGGGEPEMSFASLFFAAQPSFLGTRLSLIWGQIKELFLNPHYFLHPMLFYRMSMEYLYEFSPPEVMRLLKKLHGCKDMFFLPLFQHIAWSEDEVMSTITRELKWQKFSESKATWRSDCTVNLIKNYFYGQTLGFTKNEELVSNLIRQGVLSRKEGLNRLQNDNQIEPEYVERFFGSLRIHYDAQEVLRRITELYPLGWAAEGHSEKNKVSS